MTRNSEILEEPFAKVAARAISGHFNIGPFNQIAMSPHWYEKLHGYSSDEKINNESNATADCGHQLHSRQIFIYHCVFR